MFKQEDAIRDFVSPIVIAHKENGSYAFDVFLGTGFLIGTRGYALTAAHVVQGQAAKELVGMFVGLDSHWCAFPFSVLDTHPTEDVTLLKFQVGDWKSIFHISSDWVGSSKEYQSFGYPTDALQEDLNNKRAGIVPARPDLVFTKGYIRRRISWDIGIPGVKGRAFLELSAIAGDGCSEGPVFEIVPNKSWKVLGIYVGEKLNDRATSVSYAVRAESFVKWAPPALEGKTIENEANEA